MSVAMSWIFNHEPAVRLGAFLGIFAVMALWELVDPRRPLTTAKGPRWVANLGITIAAGWREFFRRLLQRHSK